MKNWRYAPSWAFYTRSVSWLSDFFYLLLEGIIVDKNLSDIFNNLTIINFNYDRCIAQFLFYALCGWSQKNEGTIAGVINSH